MRAKETKKPHGCDEQYPPLPLQCCGTFCVPFAVKVRDSHTLTALFNEAISTEQKIAKHSIDTRRKRLVKTAVYTLILVHLSHSFVCYSKHHRGSPIAGRRSLAACARWGVVAGTRVCES